MIKHTTEASTSNRTQNIQKRNYLIRQLAPLGYRAQWFQYWGLHLKFEDFDKKRAYDDMYKMLESEKELQSYLIWHMKVSRSTLGAYNIESQPKFIDLVNPFEFDFSPPPPLDEKFAEIKGVGGEVFVTQNEMVLDVNVNLKD